MFEYPKCPHCNYTFNDEEVWHGYGGCWFPTLCDTPKEFECPECGKSIEAIYDPIPRWYMEIPEEDELD